jgi:hypothetical protein
VKAVANGDRTDVMVDFSNPLDRRQFGFGLDVAGKWKTTWNDAGTQATLSVANVDLAAKSASGNLIVFRLMDTSGNLIGGPIEKSFDLTAKR